MAVDDKENGRIRLRIARETVRSRDPDALHPTRTSLCTGGGARGRGGSNKTRAPIPTDVLPQPTRQPRGRVKAPKCGREKHGRENMAATVSMSSWRSDAQARRRAETPRIASHGHAWRSVCGLVLVCAVGR